MIAAALLLGTVLFEPVRWSVQPLDSHRQLRYAVMRSEWPPHILVLEVVDRTTGKTEKISEGLYGDGKRTVDVLHVPKSRNVYVLTIREGMPDVADLYRVEGTHLAKTWDTGSHGIYLVRYLPGGPVVMADRHAFDYGLQGKHHLGLDVYECWTMIGEKMHCRRLAIRLRNGRFKFLPESWGRNRMKAMHVW